MSIADSFRPAVFVSIKAFSTPENQTRSIGLLRLAINAGMGIGPTLAGLIIITNSYSSLFWIDGITCIIAIMAFRHLVNAPDKKIVTATSKQLKIDKNSVYKDFSFWIFSGICFLFGMAFFQLFTIFPLYYNQIFELNEFKIGLIMFINVAIIVVFEMPFISFLEKRIVLVTKYITMSCLLLSLSFFVLYQNYWIGIIIISLVIITFSEMLGFPYTNKFALKRAKEGLEGSYMAMYTVSFSLAHIFCPLLSFSIIGQYGYQINWLITGSYCLIAVFLSYWLNHRIKNKL
jgi:predicted MFS family arabinose efflux permease